MNFATKFRVLKCYVYPVFPYNSETWTITNKMAKKLEAMEIWAFRRMQRISWVRRMSNEAVLHQTGQNRSLLKLIRKRQLGFLGHCLRKGKLEHVVVCAKLEGKRAPGRQRTTYLKQFPNTNSTEIILKAYDGVFGSLTWRPPISGTGTALEAKEEQFTCYIHYKH